MFREFGWLKDFFFPESDFSRINKRIEDFREKMKEKRLVVGIDEKVRDAAKLVVYDPLTRKSKDVTLTLESEQ